MTKGLQGTKIYEGLIALKPEGLTLAAWTRLADVSSSFFQDLKKKETQPRTDTLEKVLKPIGMTPALFYDFLARGGPAPSVRMEGVRAPAVPFTPRELNRDVPVLGTAQGADLHVRDNGHVYDVEKTIVEQSETIAWVRRPPMMEGRKDIYALYIVGDSMAPRFRSGDLVYVDPGRPPAIGDDVIVQLMDDDENVDDSRRIASILVKTLVRRTATLVELAQYTPDITFKIERNKIGAIHRVVPLHEMMSF